MYPEVVFTTVDAPHLNLLLLSLKPLGQTDLLGCSNRSTNVSKMCLCFLLAGLLDLMSVVDLNSKNVN